MRLSLWLSTLSSQANLFIAHINDLMISVSHFLNQSFQEIPSRKQKKPWLQIYKSAKWETNKSTDHRHGKRKCLGLGIASYLVDVSKNWREKRYFGGWESVDGHAVCMYVCRYVFSWHDMIWLFWKKQGPLKSETKPKDQIKIKKMKNEIKYWMNKRMGRTGRHRM